MIKFITALSALLLMTTANAQSWAERAESFKDTWRDGSDTVRILTGAHADAGHIGLEYEHRMGVSGLGVMFMQTAKSTHLFRPALTTIAITAPIHLTDRSPFDVYVAPGINTSNFQDVGEAANEDKTTFGFALKWGLMYQATKNWSAGLDFSKIHNLNDNKSPDEINLISFAAGYTW